MRRGVGGQDRGGVIRGTIGTKSVGNSLMETYYFKSLSLCVSPSPSLSLSYTYTHKYVKLIILIS